MSLDARDEVHERFVEYRRTGSRRLRDALVEEHVGLAEYLARRFADRGESFDDLRQVALVGLLKAVERFEPDRGLRFSTFATPTIVGELKRHFRDRGWALRVPRRVQELHLQLVKVVGTLSQELGRSPTPDEIARRTGTRVEDVLEAMEAGGVYRLASLDAALANEERSSLDLSARLGEDETEFEGVEQREELAGLLSNLPPRERRIVYLRFFDGLTQSEIANEVGISQMHVSRLLTKSLESLRSAALAGSEP
ncbi:MAG TPA: SigB/SigF/SigG family RNA polymerase sigma factor [Acidimicrobiia bacterium]|nr:SigB/SigF/SigG family RNA polymerase sigma factor [Acidimicrobiia bacterium]